ncbi:MAG TPA: hypothetical protein PKW95_12780 [bacterium]|nr:hypothetical protein [bacterium]
MKKVEMVRCFVTSPNPDDRNPEKTNSQVRYIPGDIFRLWRYLMEEVKGFALDDEQVSFWVDEEMYSKENSTYGDHQKEKVVEVSFLYFRDSEVGRPVIRYFPLEHLEGILNFFLKNFSDKYIQGGMRKVPGYFISKKAD